MKDQLKARLFGLVVTFAALAVFVSPDWMKKIL
jgi:hypothetical protein